MNRDDWTIRHLAYNITQKEIIHTEMIGAEFQVLFSSNWAMIMIAGGREKKITRRIIEIETLIMP